MDKNPVLLSICCITYNHENYISQAIEGFLAQKTSFNFEIIIHDDASTDATASIVKKYEQEHPNLIKAIYQKENQYSQGIKPWPNFVFPIARGKYIALCEGDDYWTDPYKLQKQVDFLEANEKIILCYHNFDTHPQGHRYQIQKNYDHKFTFKDTLKIKQGATLSMVFRNMFRYNSTFLELKGDWALELFLLLHGQGYYLKEVMGVYRIHDKGVSRQPEFQRLSLINKRRTVLRLIKYKPFKTFPFVKFLFDSYFKNA
jgi:glycosyltransferase involved in cell wall biosynthesis